MSNSFIIILTRKCYPCGCSYCNVLKNDFNNNFWKESFSNKDYIESILKKLVIFLNSNNYKNIRFFGGEVFLEKEILIFIINKLYEFGFKGEIFINTNLHLFEESDIEWIKKYNIKIITSLNGFSDLHCRTRGIKSSDYIKLIDSIKKLVVNNIFVQVNTVLFPYEDDYIEKIKLILKLNVNKINLLPLMYSNLINKEAIDNIIKKTEILFKWISNNNLHNIFLNFNILKNETSSFPLVMDEIVLDYDGNIYTSMLVLEKFIDDKKSLLFLTNIDNIKNIEIIKDNIMIDMHLLYLFLNKKDFFKNSVILSNLFTDLLLKYKKGRK